MQKPFRDMTEEQLIRFTQVKPGDPDWSSTNGESASAELERRRSAKIEHIPPTGFEWLPPEAKSLNDIPNPARAMTRAEFAAIYGEGESPSPFEHRTGLQ